MTEEEEFESSTQVRSRSSIDNFSALQAFGTGNPQPGTLVKSADPTALVQQQFALPTPEPSSVSAASAPAAAAAPAARADT